MSQARTIGEANALRAEFFGWQCRLRQHVMRYAAGRPAPGLRPQVSLVDEGAKPDAIGTPAGEIIVLINKTESQTFAQQFRHMVLMTALFGPQSEVAERLLAHGHCRMNFDQFNQRFQLDCIVRELPEHDHSYQVTYWHNRLFNPAMPAGVRILGFEPDWMTAVSEAGSR